MPRLPPRPLSVFDGVERRSQVLYDTFSWNENRSDHIFLFGHKETVGKRECSNIYIPGQLASDQTFVVTALRISGAVTESETLVLYLGDKPQITSPLDILKDWLHLPHGIVVPVRQIVSVQIWSESEVGRIRLNVLGYAVRDAC